MTADQIQMLLHATPFAVVNEEGDAYSIVHLLLASHVETAIAKVSAGSEF